MEIDGDGATSPTLAMLGGIALLSLIYIVGKKVYELFYDPLSHIPGPRSSAVSRLPYIRHSLRGSMVTYITDLHKQYGDVVRISPNQVSFTSIDTAFSDIYGFRTGKLKGHLNMEKDPIWYPNPPNGATSILKDNDEDHTKGRRLLSHAFSDKALAGQEPLIQTYVDQLIDRLKEVTAEHPSQDMTKWMNWTTFDVIADLLFGEPFGSLQDLSTHKYITLLFNSVKSFRMFYIMTYFPFAKYLGSLIVDKKAIAQRLEFTDWILEQVRKRCARDTQRPDFMTHILAHNGEKGMTMTEAQLQSNANLLLVAGSETTATLLSGALHCLLANRDKLDKLKEEVRSRWKDYHDITIAEVNAAPYLLAVLSEALRFFPPVPAGFERRVGPGGEEVSGHFLPAGTAVSVSHYPAYHSPQNFKSPDAFVPERWMGDPQYADDKRAFCQPFSFGPRNCLGKNLAYAEMRLILAKLIWSFDMELEPECRDWMAQCKVLSLWDKPPLMVRVKEVVR